MSSHLVVRARGACEPLRQAGDLLGEAAIHRADDTGLHRRQTTQLPWRRDYPLPDGHVGADAIVRPAGGAAMAEMALPPLARLTGLSQRAGSDRPRVRAELGGVVRREERSGS